jgi:Uma2 family endonuclease
MSILSSRHDWVTAADLLEQLGGIAPTRLRLRPAPGTATEKDLLAIHRREDRLYELVDGCLVEKVLGFPQSSLHLWLGFLLETFLFQNDLGILGGEAGLLRLMPGLIRLPDLSFISWERLPDRKPPSNPILHVVPDLTVEIVSRGNTKKEMNNKIRDYFLAGVRQVWIVDPKKETIHVYTGPDAVERLSEDQVLEGGEVLPGFRVSLREVFATPAERRQRKKTND